MLGDLAGHLHGEQVAPALDDDLGHAASGGAAAAPGAHAAGRDAGGAELGQGELARAAVHEQDARAHGGQGLEDGAALGAVEGVGGGAGRLRS